MVAAVQFISSPNYTNLAAAQRTGTIDISSVPESAGRMVIPYAVFTKSGGRNTQSLKANGAESFVSGTQLQTATTTGQVMVVGKPISVPTGTSVDLIHTLDGKYDRQGMGVIVCSGVSGLSALTRAFKFGADDGTADGAALAYPDNGLLVAIHQNTVPTATGTTTFSGVDAAPSADSGNSNVRGVVRAYAGHTPAETAHAVSAIMPSAGNHMLGLFTFSADDGSNTPVTVTLKDMDLGRVVQRVPGFTVATLKVGATFTMPTGQVPADAQVLITKGSTTVKDWTTLRAATIDGGGGIAGSVDGIGWGDGYILTIRIRNAAGVEIARSTGVNTWGVGANVGIAGSSSADNIDNNAPGSVVLSPQCRKNDVYEGTKWTNNTVGGGIRQIANALLANLPVGVPIGFICGGVGGSSLTAAANDQSHWESGSANFNNFRDRVLSLEGKLEALIFCGGSNDVKTSAGFQGVPTHAGALQSFTDRSRSAFGQPDLPLFLLGAQRSTLSSAPSQEAGWVGLTQAEQAFTTNNPNVYFVSTMKDLVIGGDFIHPTDSAYVTVGARMGRCMAAVLYGDIKAYLGPKLKGWVYNPANGIVEVTWDLRGFGDGILGAQGSQENIVGYRVTAGGDDTTRIPFTNSKITGPNKSQFTIATGPIERESHVHGQL